MENMIPAPFTNGADLSTDWIGDVFNDSTAAYSTKKGVRTYLGFFGSEDLPVKLTVWMFTNNIEIAPIISEHALVSTRWQDVIKKQINSRVEVDGDELRYKFSVGKSSVNVSFFYPRQS